MVCDLSKIIERVPGNGKLTKSVFYDFTFFIIHSVAVMYPIIL